MCLSAMIWDTIIMLQPNAADHNMTTIMQSVIIWNTIMPTLLHPGIESWVSLFTKLMHVLP